MKKILFIALLAFGMSAKAQISLEHTYDSASTFYTELSPGSGSTHSQLMIINFEVSGERYVKINRWARTIDIYEMNHSFIKSISLASLPTMPATNGQLSDILYISEQLFDTDPKIEFLYCTMSPLYTGIYNEDGTLLFTEIAAPAIRLNIPVQQLPIYNTAYGTKMILSYTGSNITDFKAKVFSLPGTLTTAIQEDNTPLLNEYASNLKLSAPYPNPTENTTQIDYTLPKGITHGEIVFYTLAGAEIKRFKVDNTFNTLLISTADIEAGTYYYQLQTAAENSGGKKMVVIK